MLNVLDEELIPFETKLYLSRRKGYFWIFIGLILVSISLISLVKLYFWSLILTIFGLYLCYLGLKLFSKVPQLIINEKGIQIINSTFFEWENIQNEKIVKSHLKGVESQGLKFEYFDSVEGITISDLYYSKESIEDLLIIYRKRYQNNKNG